MRWIEERKPKTGFRGWEGCPVLLGRCPGLSGVLVETPPAGSFSHSDRRTKGGLVRDGKFDWENAEDESRYNVDEKGIIMRRLQETPLGPPRGIF